ncbi:ribonuclease H-like domain-containing protein [Penicillium waksmanii]|uniref:ribonuclease H-like domain-containing protein n=1 Tax=Penicillium waksmanii TaxID=69791 RepID=UPI0025469B6F|nr:ribonuclease H-like domain-containing protein [Penicillium waksmanii]KAJ5976327.1 ribonuclease H-like domain-containing protein [Penicillium waksmanii]
MSSSASTFQSSRPTEIERSDEILADLNGLTMDKKDMINQKYKYRFEQYQDWEILRNQVRCVDCFVLEQSSEAKRRKRPATQAEKDEARRESIRYYDFWPEGKPKPMIFTSGGNIITSNDPRTWGYILQDDFPKLDLNIEQYYPPGEYARAMQSKPRHKIEPNDDNRKSLIPEWREKPLLGVEMDPQKPCYTVSGMNKNFEVMEWWNYIIPYTWSDYLAKSRDITTVRKARCIGHPGMVGDNRKWSCCGSWADANGCHHSDYHRFPQLNEDEAREVWHLYPTPDPSAAIDPRTAVALSCEKGIATNGDHEIVRIGMIDFFTGEVLINSLVFPSKNVKMLHLNTHWSGVDWQMLHSARAMKTVLEGRDAARSRVWDFVGPETIIITYSGGSRDLLELRMIHRRVIDIEELESRREKSVRINLWKTGLRKLVPVHLKRPFPKGSNGNVLEATVALRDLTHWYMTNLPPVMKTKLEQWPKKTKEELQAEAEYAIAHRDDPFFCRTELDEDSRLCLLHNVPREGNEYIRPEIETDFWDPQDDWNNPLPSQEDSLWA